MTKRTTINLDTINKAKGLYDLLKGLTSGPPEGCAIIQIMHMLLWMESANGEQSPDQMLTEYVEDFKFNLEQNQEHTLQ